MGSVCQKDFAEDISDSWILGCSYVILADEMLGSKEISET